MIELSCSKTSAAAPDRLFSTATDFQNGARIVKGITRMEMLTSGPVGVGTRFRETRTMFGREATEEMEVTAFDPPRSFRLECRSHGCHYATEFRVTPKDGGTEIGMHFRCQPLTFGAKVMGLLMRPMAKKMLSACSRDLEDIALHAEGRS